MSHFSKSAPAAPSVTTTSVLPSAAAVQIAVRPSLPSVVASRSTPAWRRKRSISCARSRSSQRQRQQGWRQRGVGRRSGPHLCRAGAGRRRGGAGHCRSARDASAAHSGRGEAGGAEQRQRRHVTARMRSTTVRVVLEGSSCAHFWNAARREKCVAIVSQATLPKAQQAINHSQRQRTPVRIQILHLDSSRLSHDSAFDRSERHHLPLFYPVGAKPRHRLPLTAATTI